MSDTEQSATPTLNRPLAEQVAAVVAERGRLYATLSRCGEALESAEWASWEEMPAVIAKLCKQAQAGPSGVAAASIDAQRLRIRELETDNHKLEVERDEAANKLSRAEVERDRRGDLLNDIGGAWAGDPLIVVPWGMIADSIKTLRSNYEIVSSGSALMKRMEDEFAKYSEALCAIREALGSSAAFSELPGVVLSMAARLKEAEALIAERVALDDMHEREVRSLHDRVLNERGARARAEAEIGSLRTDLEKANRQSASLQADLSRARSHRDDLQRFKDYVHRRLDGAGIPTHPEGRHTAEGCRVGDRLDIALGRHAAQLLELAEAVRPVLEIVKACGGRNGGGTALSFFENVGHGGGRSMSLSWESLNRALKAAGMATASLDLPAAGNSHAPGGSAMPASCCEQCGAPRHGGRS